MPWWLRKLVTAEEITFIAELDAEEQDGIEEEGPGRVSVNTLTD